MRSGEVIRRPSLYFDEADRFIFKRDDVNLAARRDSFAISSDRYFEIRKDEPITIIREKLRGDSFTVTAGLTSSVRAGKSSRCMNGK